MVQVADVLADRCRPLDPQEVIRWRQQIDEAGSRGAVSWRESLELVRRGILLRRQSDVADRQSPLRHEVLRLLPAGESLCHEAVAAAVAGPDAADVRDAILQQIAEDEQYLAGIAHSDELSADTVAFALESFRDDLHWLSTLVSVLDGGPGVDALERVLIEQDGLHRRWGLKDTPEPGTQLQPDALGPTQRAELCEALAQLRRLAIVRQVEAFLATAEPSDPADWYRRWQTASRLWARVAVAMSSPPGAGPEKAGEESGTPCGTLAGMAGVLACRRQEAARRWQESLQGLPEPERLSLLREAAEDLADRASEAMTFLEEQPIAAAVQSLESVRDDMQTCLATLEQGPSRSLRGVRRMLRRRRRALDGELQERRLAWGLERLLGRRGAMALEKLILLLLLVFILMLSIEGPLLRREAAWQGMAVESMVHSRVEAVFAWLDLAICVVFLGEFALKLALAQGKGLYVRRNWLTGLLPAIPVGFLAYATHHLALAVEGEWVVAIRALRYLRLSRVAEWLRVARPLLRLARLVGFMLWTSDRLVRRMSPLLNRNVVVFEQAALEELGAPHHKALESLRERFSHLAADAEELEPAARLAVLHARVADLRAKLGAPTAALARTPSAGPASSREIPLEDVIVQLLSATPASVAERFGRGLARSIAQWCRAFDVFAVRRLPVIRDLVAASRLADPYEAAARAGNRIGLLGRRLLERVYWFADLYGTVTAPQLVDSIGEWMIRGTAQPARRFLLFGTLFVLLSHLVLRLPHPGFLDYLAALVNRVLGTPLVVLGTFCLIPLLVGLWFRQIAGEASDFYTKVAEAQFLSGAKRMKRRLAQRWHSVWIQRVLAPEAELAGAAGTSCGDALRATVERLWDDYLDGAPLHRSDTRVTTQLLGNLDLLSLYSSRLRYGRRRRKQLRRLDLSAARGSLRGPYLWFHFISRSLTQQTAKLVVDYNTFAIPVDRLARATEEEVRAYAAWLVRRGRCGLDALGLPPAVRQRLEAAGPATSENGQAGRLRQSFQGSDFTALHFLSDEAELADDIRRRYGPWVAELMERDRRDNIRRVFRAYPLHHWPKEQRTFNPLVFYQQHLAGGWVLVFPLKVAWWLTVLGWRALRLVGRKVREVLSPPVAEVSELADDEPLAVALRKVHRMRKPVFLQCLQLRAEFDPEYLGVLLPGCPGLRGPTVPVDDDLNLIAAEPPLRRQLAQLAAGRRRQVLDLRYWLRRLGLDDEPAESLRAMALAYIVDHCRVRSLLESVRAVERSWAFAATRDSAAQQRTGREVDRAPRRGAWGPLRAVAGAMLGAKDVLLRPFRFRRQRFERQAERVLAYPWLANIPRGCHPQWIRQAWERPELRKAVQTLACFLLTPDPLAEARDALQAVARDPAPWTRQLVVLRAVQTLSVLDLQLYCDLVARLGRYPENPSAPELTAYPV